jgi:hypothetical protein
MIGKRTNTESIFPQDLRFYRNDKNDVYLRCVCGYEEIIAKNTSTINDQFAKQMRESAANHNCVVAKVA